MASYAGDQHTPIYTYANFKEVAILAKSGFFVTDYGVFFRMGRAIRNDRSSRPLDSFSAGPNRKAEISE